jgi:hypothetical protein
LPLSCSSSLSSARNSSSFCSGLSSPTKNIQLKHYGLHFVLSLTFDLLGMGGPTRSLRFHQHNPPAHWTRISTLHYKAVIMEEEKPSVLSLIYHR